MHGSGAVAGIGESTYYKRDEASHTEFQLACIAIRRRDPTGTLLRHALRAELWEGHKSNFAASSR